MPTVPTLDSPQVRSAGIPNTRVQDTTTLETFGGGQALERQTQAANQLTRSVAGAVDEARARANETRLLEERKALFDWEKQNIYGPEGARSKRGRNAFGVPDELNSSLDKFVQEREANLSGDDQKLRFRQMVEARREGLGKWAQEYVGQQREAYEEEEFVSSIESAKERGSIDPARNANLEAAFIRQTIMKRGERMGWGEERIGQELAKQESDLHFRAISQMLNSQDDLGAQAHFKKVEAGMDPDIRAKAQHILEEGVLRGSSLRRADEITKGAPTLSAALEKVREIEDPKLRDATVSRVRDFYSLKKQAEQERDDDLFKQAANILEETKDRSKISPAIWTQLSLSHRNAIDARAEQLIKGETPRTSWGDYYNLKTQASSPELRNDFARTNLLQYRHKLADSEFKELVNLQTSIRKGDGESEKTLSGFRSNMQVVNSTLKAAGIDPAAKEGTRDAEELNQFYRAIDERILNLQQETGRKASSQDVQRLTDELLIQTRVPNSGIFFDTKRRVFERKEGETLEVVSVKDLPAREKAAIEATLKKYKVAPTEEAILRVYNAKLNRK